jgi:hypothetical protein
MTARKRTGPGGSGTALKMAAQARVHRMYGTVCYPSYVEIDVIK